MPMLFWNVPLNFGAPALEKLTVLVFPIRQNRVTFEVKQLYGVRGDCCHR